MPHTDPPPPRPALRSPALALALAGLLGGCASPGLRPEALPEPALAAIQDAFERTVTAALEDPAVHWQSGWLGNARINLFGGARQGLCYEWRDLVYAGVLPTLEEVGTSRPVPPLRPVPRYFANTRTAC